MESTLSFGPLLQLVFGGETPFSEQQYFLKMEIYQLWLHSFGCIDTPGRASIGSILWSKLSLCACNSI